MNILFPMGGIGSRFAKENYRFPKPLVNIVGRPMLSWIIDRLSIAPEDTIWMAVMQDVEANFTLSEKIRHEFPGLDIRLVTLNFETRGAAETLFIILQQMNEEELNRKIISLDCDTIYFSDILKDFRALPESAHGCSFYFEDLGTKPIFSYIAFEGEQYGATQTSHNRIVEVREKHAISRHANTGGYGFANGHLLKEHCAKLIDEATGELGEYYTSQVIARMLSAGCTFYGIHVPSFDCVGTPSQLQDFLLKIKGDNNILRIKPRRFCFDLDNTLVTYPLVRGDYTTVQPKPQNIKLVQQLKAAGHYIIIQTARRMKTQHGNVGAVLKDIGLLTMQSLKDLGIPYDELHFGKPHADVYVDDLGVNALVDTAKELGWSLDDPASLKDSKKLIGGFVCPRSFNTIQEISGNIMKSSSPDILAGEVYFYQNIPEALKDLFPTLIEVDCSNPNISAITISKLHGVTFTHLILNQCVTQGRLLKLLSALSRIHTFSLPEGNSSSTEPSIYANYAPKLKSRYAVVDAYVGLVAPKTSWNPEGRVEVLFDRILDFLTDYEQQNRGYACDVIHGDPVFSNVLLDKHGKVKFLDMRGSLGSQVTLRGDLLYDLSKVYQSILGYDYILEGKSLDAQCTVYLKELEDVFFDFVGTNYPKVAVKDIQALTASHLFSIVPLHCNEVRQSFLNASSDIIERMLE